ncbi:MAG: ribosome maturation factor RimP [Gammaproteobacteria bacterium]
MAPGDRGFLFLGKELAYSRALTEKLSPTVVGLGYELLGIEIAGGTAGSIVRCYIDSEHGISVDDCGRVSRQLGDLIEAEQLLTQAYTLEVSSPGVDRPLFTLQQIAAQCGAVVEVRLAETVEGRRKIEGEVLAVEGETVILGDANSEYEIPYQMIEKAKVVYQWTS